MNVNADLLIAMLAFIAALGAGIIGGVFFAFSNFVMKALSRLQNPQGVAAMQSINVVVLNRWFLGVFLGTALLSAIACAVAVAWWDSPRAPALLAGGVLYLLGCFAVTIICNVPRNEALAAIPPDDMRVEEAWPRYVAEWNRWNHVRTAASLAAAAAFMLALVG